MSQTKELFMMADDGTINYWLDNAKGKDKMPEKPQKPKTFQERFWWASPTALIEIGEFGFEKKQEGAKSERERIHQDIAEMQNPYPKDVFISEKYDSWRQAWGICHKKVMELI